jgi:hypothetical protein
LDIAASAARAGLQFVILTDHGDATREPRAPAYHDGVLTIDAVEISAEGGHVVALDLPVSPYPLGGELRDVLADVERLGGMAIAAHPGSPRVDLQWTEWDASFGGLEWLNADSEWRDETWAQLARALLSYPIRPAPALAGLFDRPVDDLRRWDELTRLRPVVAVAGSDAHARISFRSGEGSNRSAALPLPSYQQLFRTLSVTVTGVELGGSALEDARAVLDGLRRGHVYSVIDALAGPVLLDFRAASGQHEAVGGDRLALDGTAVLRARSNAPPGARLTLLRDGVVVAEAPALGFEHIVGDEGVYRVELHLPRAPGVPPVPWVVSNPIYMGVGEAQPSTAATVRPPTAVQIVYDDGPAAAWRVESSPRSDGVLDVVAATNGTQLSLRYGLGGAASESQYVALVAPVEGSLAAFDRLAFSAASFRPMRISVQLRAGGGRGERRWRRSVYVDQTPKTHTVMFEELRPVGPVERSPVLSEIEDLLFVVDTVHSTPGSSGQLWLDEIGFGR